MSVCQCECVCVCVCVCVLCVCECVCVCVYVCVCVCAWEEEGCIVLRRMYIMVKQTLECALVDVT